jgi:REP element-mobilizing transposase RayT
MVFFMGLWEGSFSCCGKYTGDQHIMLWFKKYREEYCTLTPWVPVIPGTNTIDCCLLINTSSDKYFIHIQDYIASSTVQQYIENYTDMREELHNRGYDF